ncbi:CPBP family intramembrane glutamic endopeptidase [Anaerobaca lacustris]|uniref:Type II CAAX endopeptidase family protein n=1 Tax=Anaerobaca lacustris TaxID=3044600 RepID=A0AAW6TY75_9BACT|nr:type II CAAX endopeptidase family protein [Sedimentisphaerales bacterium M17dextr]
MTAPETFKQLTESVTIDHVSTLIGIGVFSVWLARTSLGRKSLTHCPARRNNMLPHVPFIPFFLWLLGTFVVQSLVVSFVRPVDGLQRIFQDQLVFCVVALLTVFGLVLPLASFHFARGLKGFGLRIRTVPKDLVAAFVHLLAVWPLVLAMFVATMRIGQWVSQRLSGRDFQIPQHEALEMMTQHSNITLTVLLVFLAVVVAPLVEETIFRGLFQSMVRSYLGRPWLAIGLTSVLFAAIHKDMAHWPALFALSIGLGYAYEKSGSLFRPVFMHAMFNGISILGALVESGPA